MRECKLIEREDLNKLVDKLKSEATKENIFKYVSAEKAEDEKILILMSKSYLSYPLEFFQVREDDWKNLKEAYINAGDSIRVN